MHKWKPWKPGDAYVWLTGGGLALGLIMVFGLILLILVNGLGFFWPGDVMRLRLKDGREVIGQVVDREAIPAAAADARPVEFRIKVKQGNRDLYGADFVWIDESEIASRDRPADAVLVERREWGNFYGMVESVADSGTTVASGAGVWDELEKRLRDAQSIFQQIRRIEFKQIAALNYEQEQIRLRKNKLAMRGVTSGPEIDRLEQKGLVLSRQYDERQLDLDRLRQRLTASVMLVAAGGLNKDLNLEQIVRVYRPNRMGRPAKLALYGAKLWEFVSADPRESNTEGGVFPAMFGTVMMVLIMSLLVTPLGVLAALYLREYATPGLFVSVVRIAVNNLAGVPSIVFGVFGVGFFIYFVGSAIDRTFFTESLPTPTFGTGGILWASLTLALLTVPVVIVATEEGLAAIPGGMREASLALGATKFETTWRVVLPSVMPSVMTGLILAMSRAAGEVAPLMITGVVKLAPALPVDGNWPFFHLDRKFMHLGFHIYDVGFQSPNVEAARPMVFTTTLLLLAIVVVLNLSAITLRTRLRKKYASAAV